MAQNDQLIGTGFQFPIRVNAKGGLDWSSGPGRIRDAIRIILFTAAGERVMRPTFGAGVEDFVFEPNSAASRMRLADAIRHSLSLWEPRIELVNVDVAESPRGPSHAVATIGYRIRSTNELQNLVYPLYVREGVG